MIRIAICDDEKILLESACGKIKSIVDSFGKGCVIEAFQDGNKMLSHMEKGEDHPYFFKTEDGEIKLNTSDILYIECLNRKIYIKTYDKKYGILGLQFNKIINEFLSKGFVLIHRTCIVNLKYIYSIEKLIVRMDNDEMLPMSRHKTNDVKRAFTLYAE